MSERRGVALSREYTPSVYSRWGVSRYHVAGVWGAGVGVLVVDAGLLAMNPDVGGVVRLDFAGNAHATTPHGQYVTSLLAAPQNDWGTVGIAPSSAVYLANVQSANGAMLVSSVVAALDAAKSMPDVDVISISLGTDAHHAQLQRAVSECVAAGKLVFAACGNSGEAILEYPAYYPGVVSVGSVSAAGTPSAFNTRNDAVALFAPGEGLQFVAVDDASGTALVQQSGTSFSTPFAAGLAALALCSLRGLHGSSFRLSRSQVLHLLRNPQHLDLSCAVHSYVRTDNPCVSSASGPPVEVDIRLLPGNSGDSRGVWIALAIAVVCGAAALAALRQKK